MESELVDDSFKKPGAIPFKWEIRPGVPKVQQYYDEEFSSFPETPRKLTPPPPSAAGYCSKTGSFRSTPPPPPPPRSGSSRSRSFRFYSSNNNHNNLPQQQQQQRNIGVSTASGCFPSPLLIKRRKEKNKTKKKHKITSKEETVSNSDVEILSPRLSVSSCRSSWKSLSPLRDSPLSSSFSSYSYQYSTPPPPPPCRRLGKVNNDAAADWAGFGLF